jgi:folate-binding protein YgfZ
MTSQELTSLRAGDSAETLLLDPNGRIEVVIRIIDDGSNAWLIVDHSVHEALITHLERMRFSLRVEIVDRSDSVFPVGYFRGGTAEQVVASLTTAASIPLWVDPWQSVVPGGWQYALVAEHPSTQWAFSVALLSAHDRVSLLAEVRAGRTGAAGLLAYEALRIESWRPSQSDVDNRALPHEFDWLRSAVHLTKGCYRGQETVAKVHNLGHPPRRLAMIHLDGSDVVLPTAGDLVTTSTDDAPVGRVTSVARHYEWGSIALVLLKRSVAVDAQLKVLHDDLSIPATQEVIVPPDAGSTRGVPRLSRL